MKKVKAFIERGNDSGYGVYVDLDDNSLNYGIHGNGDTVKDAVGDFLNSYEEMRAYFSTISKHFVEAEFEFLYDVPSFLAYYGSLLSPAGMERLTGVKPAQISHYVTGRRKPSERTARKITAKLREFGKELTQIELV